MKLLNVGGSIKKMEKLSGIAKRVLGHGGGQKRTGRSN